MLSASRKFSRRVAPGLVVLLLLSLSLAVGAAPAVQAATTVITVTSSADSGPGSLRAAIVQANNTSGPVEIRFNLPGYDPIRKITLSSSLPLITNTGGVFINGYSQPGA